MELLLLTKPFQKNKPGTRGLQGTAVHIGRKITSWQATLEYLGNFKKKLTQIYKYWRWWKEFLEFGFPTSRQQIPETSKSAVWDSYKTFQQKWTKEGSTHVNNLMKPTFLWVYL